MRFREEEDKTGPGRNKPAHSFLEGLASLRSDPFVKEVRSAQMNSGARVWLVGGVLRNLALGRPLVPDYDFVIEGADLKDFTDKVAGSVDGSAFLLDKETLSYRVVAKTEGKPCNLDFSPVKGDILNDLGQRDFTVNSLAASLDDIFENPNPAVMDPFGGIKDARLKCLRATAKRVFDEDPLRTLRAVRLAVQYRFKISRDTIFLMKKKSSLLEATSAERKRDELILIFACDKSSRAIKLMYSTGIIGALLPEASGWEDINGYKLLEHSLKTLDSAEGLLKEISEKVFPGFSSELAEHFSRRIGTIEVRTVFKLAAFLHDFGKPHRMSREGGRMRFIGHDSAGGHLVKEALLRLKFSRRIAAEISGLVKNHHRVFNLASLPDPSPRTKAHLFRAAGGNSGLTLLCLALADSKATRGEEDKELLKLVNDMLGFYYGVYVKKKPAPLLDGSEIMAMFGVPEGPLVGTVIKRISEGLEKGEIKNRKDAVAFIEAWLKKRKRS